MLPQIRLKRGAPAPLHEQLMEQLRTAILEGALPPGTRLPPSRRGATELGVSRNVVVLAYEQLILEGYLDARVGRGTWVPRSLPGHLLPPERPSRTRRRGRPSTGAGGGSVHGTGRGSRPGSDGGSRAGSEEGDARRGAPRLSLQGERLAGARRIRGRLGGRPGAFMPGVADPSHFPGRTWSRIERGLWRSRSARMVPYGDGEGYRPLREAIADHVRRHRGVRCDWAQVIVTSGSQQGLDLIARMLVDPGDRVALEEPGYRGAKVAFEAAGAELVPVPVDEEGLDPSLLEGNAGPGGARAAGSGGAGPDATRSAAAAATSAAAGSDAPGSGEARSGADRSGAPRLLYATPSHQYPLGVTLTLSRRLRILEWAREAGTWIVEDDYDSEFRYESRPLPCLQGLDPEGRVIYLGTFSKVLAPGLRLGFLVLPEPLVEAFGRARAAVDTHAPIILQATLAGFMEEGHLERHIARMKAIYGERRAALTAAIERELDGAMEVPVGAAGLHLTALLDPGIDDREVSRLAGERDIEAPPLSDYSVAPPGRRGLVLGYGAVPVENIEERTARLAEAVLANPHPNPRQEPAS